MTHDETADITAASPQPSFRSLDARAAPFGFVCSQCSLCCYDKRIQVNPYEIARLAQNRGIAASEVRHRFTEQGAGTHLARTESGACVFLGERGCTVHADRPLVCRLYPLGRQIDSDGAESFRHWVPHPRSRGTHHTNGTIGEFLCAQETDTSIRAADSYFWWFVRARSMTSMRSASGREANLEQNVAPILDLDAATAGYCAHRGQTPPADIEDRRELHVQILDEYLTAVRQPYPKQHGPSEWTPFVEQFNKITGSA